MGSQKELCAALYKHCLETPDEEFSQTYLLTLEIIPENDVKLLFDCMSTLCSQRRFIRCQGPVSGAALWKVVKKEDTARYKGLSKEEAIVLSYVDDAQKEGIWVRHIRSRSGIAQNSVNLILKKLEQKNIIKQVTNAKNPARKHYMLYHLEPSEDVTGGPFYTEGSLDEDYVFQISKVVYDFVARQSWGQKAKHYDARDVQESGLRDAHGTVQKLPMLPNYAGYPTLSEITRYINYQEVSSVGLVETDIKQLLDILCWDGKLCRVAGGKAYKSIQNAHDVFDGNVISNGYTEAPCGRCPVFGWCEEHGPVNSKTCTYLEDWLQ